MVLNLVPGMDVFVPHVMERNVTVAERRDDPQRLELAVDANAPPLFAGVHQFFQGLLILSVLNDPIPQLERAIG